MEKPGRNATLLIVLHTKLECDLLLAGAVRSDRHACSMWSIGVQWAYGDGAFAVVLHSLSVSLGGDLQSRWMPLNSDLQFGSDPST